MERCAPAGTAASAEVEFDHRLQILAAQRGRGRKDHPRLAPWPIGRCCAALSHQDLLRQVEFLAQCAVGDRAVRYNANSWRRPSQAPSESGVADLEPVGGRPGRASTATQVSIACACCTRLAAAAAFRPGSAIVRTRGGKLRLRSATAWASAFSGALPFPPATAATRCPPACACAAIGPSAISAAPCLAFGKRARFLLRYNEHVGHPPFQVVTCRRGYLRLGANMQHCLRASPDRPWSITAMNLSIDVSILTGCYS